MKRFLLLITVIVLVLSLVSCSFGNISIVSDTSSSDDTSADTSKSTDTGKITESDSTPETEPESPADLPYTVKEFSPVKADRIQFYPNDIGMNCFVFVSGSSYGTIDSEGRIITEPKLSSIDYQFLCSDKTFNERRFVGGYRNEY